MHANGLNATTERSTTLWIRYYQCKSSGGSCVVAKFGGEADGKGDRQVRLSLYMDPDNSGHANPALMALFNAALPLVAKILAAFDNDHLVIKNFKYSPTRNRLNDAEERVIGWPHIVWFQRPSWKLDLSHLREPVRNDRVMGVGSALQLLAVQNELTIPLASTKSGVLVTYMLKFKRCAHAIYDPNFRPPTFHREDPSFFPSCEAIPVVVKRRGDDGIDDERPGKRVKLAKTNPGQTVKKSRRSPGGRRGD
ncbi:hypothetical protein DFH09DRAFT_1069464 [Mycena vulgaris]|nr:hypothetical protein DFH09DRAFT_1069464 [Mycena vulgaris]